MIDKDTLIKISKLYGLKPWQQEKHYIQSSILSILGEESLVFKGGTYLWFFNNLPRFSEDLDFTVFEGSPKNLPKRISESMELLGIENKLKIVSNDERSLSFRISAKGPMFTSDISLCYVYLDISKREKVLNKPVSIQADFSAYNLPIKMILGMDLNEVAAEKIRAIITRKKARDVYDLYFLIKNKNVVFEKSFVNDKLKYYDLEFSKDDFINYLKEKGPYWKEELEPLVFEDLPSVEVGYKVIEKWLPL